MTTVAQELWARISERYGDALDRGSKGTLRREIEGVMPGWLERNAEPLLEPQDHAGLVLTEKEQILARHFLKPGPIAGRVRELFLHLVLSLRCSKP